ncbi:MAG TPA: amino acid racemase [Rhodothermales bacterium]
MAHRDKVIGIISGMGPYAGLDLVRKIFDHTEAVKDQDHLPVALLSYPDRIIDRSTFLFGKTEVNPAYALADIARLLEQAGAVVAGMPCNTAHAPAIFDTIEKELKASGHRIRMVHMIRETARYIRNEVPGVRRIGLLSTLAVYRLKLYHNALQEVGLETVVPDEDVQEEVVNRTIFDPVFGIKAQANPVTDRARQNLLDAIGHLADRGADAVILGCTELPLAVTESEVNGVPVLDPTDVLAKALIRETYPERLRVIAGANERPH